MKLAYDFYKSLILVNKNITKEIFLAKTGAEDGYALNMFSRLYDSITCELVNLDVEYDKYYSFEYPSLEHFLYRKYNLNEEDISNLMEERKKYPECILYRKDDLAYGGNGQLTTFAFSEAMYDRVMEMIMLKNSNQ